MPPNPALGAMSFSIPPDLVAYLQEIDHFIDTKIAPLQASDDNNRFFDHRNQPISLSYISRAPYPTRREDVLSTLLFRP